MTIARARFWRLAKFFYRPISEVRALRIKSPIPRPGRSVGYSRSPHPRASAPPTSRELHVTNKDGQACQSPEPGSCCRCTPRNSARRMIERQLYIKVGDLAVLYAPQWYVATADGILIFGPFSSVEQAMEAAKGTSSSGSASEKES